MLSFAIALSKVPDEEGGQTKAWNFLFDCRAGATDGYNEPEMSHPKYNGFKRAVNEAGLEGPLMKGTLMSQYKHQPFMSLANAKNLKQALRFKLQLGS